MLQLASAGDTLAEPSLFSPTYHCDAVATSEAQVRLYPKAILLAELRREPKLAQAFAAMLAQQVMTLRTRLERRNIHSARDRVRHFLAVNVGTDGRTVALPGTLNEAASMDVLCADKTTAEPLVRLRNFAFGTRTKRTR
jgi:CRP/FNR family transcriptional regulator, dissimilatory nitrate respiration regulator